MTRLYTDGAESGDALRQDGIVGSLVCPATTAQHRPAFFSNYAYSSNNADGFYKNITAVTEFFERSARYVVPSLAIPNRFFAWRSAGNEVGYLTVGGLGGAATVSYYQGVTLMASTSVAWRQSEWHVLEVHVLIGASGTVQVKFDGRLVLTFNGDTRNGYSNVDRIDWIFPAAGNWSYLDDIALNDTAGIVDNSWCGDGGVPGALTPNGVGNYSDLIASTGSTYGAVNTIPADTSKYIYESTIDKKSTFTLSDLPTLPAGASVARVWVELMAQESVAAGDKMATLLRSGTTDSQGSDQSLTIAWNRYLSAEYVADPQDSAAWTPTKVNALEAGCVVR